MLRRTQAMALLGQGAMGIRAGQITGGLDRLEQAYAHLEGLEATGERIALIGLLGPVAMLAMDRDAGQRAIEETLALAQVEEHAWGWPLALNFLGLFHLVHGELARAKDLLDQAVTLWDKQPGLVWCKERSMVHLGLTYHALGDIEKAQATQKEALKLARAVGDHSFIPLSMCHLAFHHCAQGELDLAGEGFANALSEAQRFGLLLSVAHCIAGLGLVAAAQGLASRAVTLFTFATTLPGGYMVFLLGQPERALAELRAELPPAEFSAAETRARSLELGELIARLSERQAGR